jgi:hypothetical protein
MRRMPAIAPDFHALKRLAAMVDAFMLVIAAKTSTAKKCLFYRHFCHAMNFARKFVQSAKTFAPPTRL